MDPLRAFESVPPAGDSGFGGLDTAFAVVFAVVGLLVLAGFAYVVYSMVRGARAAKRSGVDPFTPESVLIADALRGQAGRSVEQRLVELDDLHRRGVISADEHRAARAKALTSAE